MTISVVNNRWSCARYLRKIATSKDYGMIDNVQLTRVGLLVWHLRFDVEVRR